MLTWNDNLDAGQVVADHLFECSLHLVSQDIEGALGVVGFAVVPDQLQVVQYFLDGPILPRLQLVLHFEQVHRMLNNKGVIVEFEL